MNKEIKTAWIKALRSGKYKQGRNTLRTAENSYCCLGVLLDQHPNRNESWNSDCGDFSFDLDEQIGNMTDLAPALLEWAGLTRGDESELIAMNDTEKVSFEVIADHIENNL